MGVLSPRPDPAAIVDAELVLHSNTPDAVRENRKEALRRTYYHSDSSALDLPLQPIQRSRRCRYDVVLPCLIYD